MYPTFSSAVVCEAEVFGQAHYKCVESVQHQARNWEAGQSFRGISSYEIKTHTDMHSRGDRIYTAVQVTLTVTAIENKSM